MLIAAITALFLMSGGGGFELFGKDARALVSSVIADEARAEQVQDLMKAGAKEGQRFTKEANGLLSAWLEADRDHAAGPEEFDAQFAGAASVRAEASKAFLDTLFEVKGQMTAEEWEAVFAPEEQP